MPTLSSNAFLRKMAAEHSEIMQNSWDRENQKVVYHYTSLQGGLAILENRTVWAGHIEFTNDSGEILESKKLIRTTIEEKRTENPDSFWQKGYYDEDQFDFVLKNIDPFIFSMTGDPDNSSQWRSYGAQGYGVAIGFDVSVLESKFIDSNTLNILKVQYSKQGFREALERLLESFDKLAGKMETGSAEYSYHSTMMHAALLALSLSFKTHHHADENEFRILYYQVSDELLPLFPSEEKNVLPVNFRVSGGMGNGFHEFLAPYIEVDYFEKFPICEIVVGSKTEEELMTKALERVKRAVGHRYVVTKSKSQLR